MLQRTAPISMPGTILSQLGMQIMPSKQWAWSIVSTESAISSRLGSENFMPVVAHGDAVVDADRVEDERHAARLADALLDELADLVQVDVAGNDVDVAVADGDERLAEIVVAHAGGAEQAAVGGTGVAQLDRCRIASVGLLLVQSRLWGPHCRDLFPNRQLARSRGTTIPRFLVFLRRFLNRR